MQLSAARPVASTTAAPSHRRVRAAVHRPQRSQTRPVWPLLAPPGSSVVLGRIHAPSQQSSTCFASFQQPSSSTGLNPELRASIEAVIRENKVVVFMKGTPQFPQCGFSGTVCRILQSMGVTFEGVNILADERLRSGMKEFSAWPTFPQVYVAGEFVGGADILISMYQSGELAELLERELNS